MDHFVEIPWLYVLGIVTTVCMTLCIIAGVCKFIIKHFLTSTIDFKEYGKWAIVTGSTDGIGKAIAEELAKQGVNIFLISRNLTKLNRVAEEIQTKYDVETKVLPFDFSQFDEQDNSKTSYGVISDTMKELDVGILINNVGMKCDRAKEFLLSSESQDTLSESVTNLIHCNSTSRAKMIEIVLPGMVFRERGLIINMSSVWASVVCPMMSTYSASKRFDDTLSEALADEYIKHGIIIQSIQPNFVYTNMTKDVIENPSWQAPSAYTYVKHMMKTIGKSKRSSGYWAHRIARWFYTLLPDDKFSSILIQNVKKFEVNQRKPITK